MGRLASALIVAGLLLAAFGVAWQLELVPGSRLTLPPPVALQPTPLSATSTPRVPVSTPTSAATTPTSVSPTATLAAAMTPTPLALVAADAQDRAQITPAPGGYAVRLVIASIDLDTQVTQGGIVLDSHGVPVWETVPFVAVHYGDLTSRVGRPGNAVIAGHVVTLSEGNVFRLLSRVGIDDAIQVWDDREREHDYNVVDVKLVPPTDVSVMEPTPDETLTLITCGGTFDRVRREFSDRLIVTAKALPPPSEH